MRVHAIADRTTQGMVNALMLMRALKGPNGSLLLHKDIWTVDGERANVDGELRGCVQAHSILCYFLLVWN